ncbi:hypothetical protein LXL04_003858 [Taraxacum kok-saghyz]
MTSPLLLKSNHASYNLFTTPLFGGVIGMKLFTTPLFGGVIGMKAVHYSTIWGSHWNESCSLLHYLGESLEWKLFTTLLFGGKIWKLGCYNSPAFETDFVLEVTVNATFPHICPKSVLEFKLILVCDDKLTPQQRLFTTPLFGGVIGMKAVHYSTIWGSHWNESCSLLHYLGESLEWKLFTTLLFGGKIWKSGCYNSPAFETDFVLEVTVNATFPHICPKSVLEFKLILVCDDKLTPQQRLFTTPLFGGVIGMKAIHYSTIWGSHWNESCSLLHYLGESLEWKLFTTLLFGGKIWKSGCYNSPAFETDFVLEVTVNATFPHICPKSVLEFKLILICDDKLTPQQRLFTTPLFGGVIGMKAVYYSTIWGSHWNESCSLLHYLGESLEWKLFTNLLFGGKIWKSGCYNSPAFETDFVLEVTVNATFPHICPKSVLEFKLILVCDDKLTPQQRLFTTPLFGGVIGMKAIHYSTIWGSHWNESCSLLHYLGETLEWKLFTTLLFGGKIWKSGCYNSPAFETDFVLEVTVNATFPHICPKSVLEFKLILVCDDKLTPQQRLFTTPLFGGVIGMKAIHYSTIWGSHWNESCSLLHYLGESLEWKLFTTLLFGGVIGTQSRH